MLTSWKAYASNAAIAPPAEPVLCGATPPASPPTTPFVDSLPIPFPAAPTILFPTPTKSANTENGEANREDHQRWEQFSPDIFYYQEARAATHSFHRDLLPSYFWGFNGRYTASTVLNAYGLSTLVRFKNNLPAVTSSFGRNESDQAETRRPGRSSPWTPLSCARLGGFPVIPRLFPLANSRYMWPLVMM